MITANKHLETTAIWLTRSLKRLPFGLGRPRGNAAYIPQLDGLRAVAILLVIIWHSSLRASRLNAPVDTYPAYAPHGEIGVLLFFFISGFVITQPFLGPKSRFDGASILAFYYRRLRRICPPYLICLASCYVILGLAAYKPAGAPGFYLQGISLQDSFLASVFYVHGLVFDAPSRLNPPLWSLEIEVQFYLLSPAIMFLYLRAARARTRQTIGLLILAAAILLAGLLSSLGHYDGRGRFGLPMHFYLFFLGIFMADLARRRDWFGRPAHFAFDLASAAGFALLIKCGFALDPSDGRAVGLPDVVIQALFCIALVGIYVGAMRGRISRLVLGTPWICAIGAMCYSIYLVHVPLMQAQSQLILAYLPVEHDVVKWSLAYALLIPSALIAGAVYFRFIERPFMTAARPIARRRPEAIPAPQRSD